MYQQQTPNFCKKCGSKLQQGDTFCPACGFNITIAQTGSTVTPPFSQSKSRNCQFCGTSLLFQDTFCPSCGRPVSGQIAQTIPRSPIVAQQQNIIQDIIDAWKGLFLKRPPLARPDNEVYLQKPPFKPPGLLLIIAGIGTLAAMIITSSVQCVAPGVCADFAAFPITPFIVAVIPGLFFLWVYKQERFESEPWLLLLLLFGLGGVSTLIALFVTSLLNEPLYLVGFVEEPAKVLGVAYLVFNKKYGKEFNGPMDGLIWGAAAGAGFAVVESTEYVLKFQLYSLFIPVSVGQVALVRNFAGIGHMAWTGIAAWWLGMAKAKRGNNTLLDLIPGLTIAIFMHGAYDGISSTGAGYAVVFGLLAVFVAFFIKAVREAHMEEIAWGLGRDLGTRPTYGFTSCTDREESPSPSSWGFLRSLGLPRKARAPG